GLARRTTVAVRTRPHSGPAIRLRWEIEARSGARRGNAGADQAQQQCAQEPSGMHHCPCSWLGRRDGEVVVATVSAGAAVADNAEATRTVGVRTRDRAVVLGDTVEIGRD